MLNKRACIRENDETKEPYTNLDTFNTVSRLHTRLTDDVIRPVIRRFWQKIGCFGNFRIDRLNYRTAGHTDKISRRVAAVCIALKIVVRWKVVAYAYLRRL